MATPFHNIVHLDGTHFTDEEWTVNLAAGITKADEGKPLALDLTANTTFKIAGDGDEIAGRLEFVDTGRNNTVGTIAFEFINKFNLKAADTAVVGDTVCGSAISGEVKKAAANSRAINYIIAKTGSVVTVAKL